MDFYIDTTPIVSTPIVVNLSDVNTNTITLIVESIENTPVEQILTPPSDINTTIGFTFDIEDNLYNYTINNIENTTTSLSIVLNNTNNINIPIILSENTNTLVEFEFDDESSSIINIDTNLLDSSTNILLNNIENLSTNIELINDDHSNIIQIISNQYIQADIPI